MHTPKSTLASDPGIARWRWLFVAVLILPVLAYILGKSVEKSCPGFSFSLQLVSFLIAGGLVMLVFPHAILCCWKRSRARQKASRPWLRTELPYLIVFSALALAVMGLTQPSSSLYLSAAAILCLLLAFVVFRHLVRIWRQDPEEWGHRGGVDLLHDLQLLNWIPGILMIVGLVVGFFHSSFGSACFIIGILGCALQGVIGFSAQFWIDCKSGVPWWRSEIVRIGLGLGLFIGALWLLMPMIKSDRGAWITSDIAEKIEIGLIVVPVVILLGIFLRDAWCLRQQHPDEWTGLLVEKWRRHLGMERKEEHHFLMHQMDRLDLGDAAAVDGLIAKVRRSQSASLLALLGSKLWLETSTKELGRPLLEEAGANGSEFARYLLMMEFIEKLDLTQEKEVEAALNWLRQPQNQVYAFCLAVRLRFNPGTEKLARNLLEDLASKGDERAVQTLIEWNHQDAR